MVAVVVAAAPTHPPTHLPAHRLTGPHPPTPAGMHANIPQRNIDDAAQFRKWARCAAAVAAGLHLSQPKQLENARDTPAQSWSSCDPFEKASEVSSENCWTKTPITGLHYQTQCKCGPRVGCLTLPPASMVMRPHGRSHHPSPVYAA